MAQENKVFDVASPGSSKPETGSKPMVVGHKKMLDPTLKGPGESESSSSVPMVSHTERTLNPISKTSKTVPEKTNSPNSESAIAGDEKTEIEKEEPMSESTPESGSDSIPESTADTTTEPVTEAPEKTAEEKKKTEDDLEVAREDKLQEMIKSKEYFAPINEASFSSFQSFFKTFVIVVLIGIVALVIMIDAGILDVGISLPFDLL